MTGTPNRDPVIALDVMSGEAGAAEAVAAADIAAERYPHPLEECRQLGGRLLAERAGRFERGMLGCACEPRIASSSSSSASSSLLLLP
jgi:hypothetical protein